MWMAVWEPDAIRVNMKIFLLITFLFSILLESKHKI